jgi:tryptophanyl-tRNA synthetase
MADITPAEVLGEHGGKGFGPFKDALAGLLVEKLTPIARETQRRLADVAELEKVLREGAARAAAIADPIVSETERLVGFLRV